MKRVPFHLIPLLALLLFAGCAVPPAPEVRKPEPSANTAVVSLLSEAHAHKSAGRHEPAGASLERALRIEPRNPVLWQELALVRLEQGNYPQAENLAAKSNALAGDSRPLRAQNWRIIGEARSRRGDHQGAQAAFEQAGSR